MPGIKRAFTREECQTIDAVIQARGKFRDLALFRLALSSMAPANLLLDLKVQDVVAANGEGVSDRFSRTKDNGEVVQYTISEKAQWALETLIRDALLPMNGFLFGAHNNPSRPMTRRRLTAIIKGWAGMADLDPEFYGVHSLRRTTALHILDASGSIDAVSQLLGHASAIETREYLGVTRTDALKIADKYSVL